MQMLPSRCHQDASHHGGQVEPSNKGEAYSLRQVSSKVHFSFLLSNFLSFQGSSPLSITPISFLRLLYETFPGIIDSGGASETKQLQQLEILVSCSKMLRSTQA